MTQTKEKRRGLAPGRSSKAVNRADGPFEDTPPASAIQAAHLMHRFGLAPAVAQIVAELAFNGRPA